jgi:dTDP-glucose 4,6-dehydratase
MQNNGWKWVVIEQLIAYVKIVGSWFEYTIDANKQRTGWKPSVTFEEGLERTVTCYLENQTWLNNITSGEYATITKQYL